ncbi:pyroglutamyl-peptidase [Rhodotorula toruloides]|uniref:Pyroglutamyl-peptidase n=1 Tax=Rhodotorula toruloides TaxID=5286 RepID=A0A511KEY5_RHOTO|nr:pyroglutamyl-peptidase [Rhodotorula toruloides]
MPPLGQVGDTQRPFRVHITGFGPFRDVTINPSWEAVQPLNNTTLESEPLPDGHASSIAASPRKPSRPIHFSTSFLPVEYDPVTRLAPALQDARTSEGPPDLIVHVGVSGQDRQIRLEHRARKFGYDSTDATDKLAYAAADGRRGFVGETWRDSPEELRTRVDGAKVVERLKAAGFEHISLSDDAGLYLCEYSFYASMATAKRRRPDNPMPVQFIHIPPEGKPYTIEELTAAIRLIVWTILNGA